MSKPGLCVVWQENVPVQSRALWYALNVRERLEVGISRNLEAKGYESFLPSYMSRRMWSDRTKLLEVSLFPGYVFCRFDFSDRLPVLSVPGVKSVVGIGKLATPVEERELEAVRAVVKSGLACGPWPFLSAGQLVRLERGPLRDVEGIILEVKGTYRLVVSISLLMRSVSVEVDRDWVRPITRTAQYQTQHFNTPSRIGA